MHKNQFSYQHNVIRPGSTTRLIQYQHPLDKICNPASAEDTSNKCTHVVYSLRRDCVTENKYSYGACISISVPVQQRHNGYTEC